MVMGFYIPLLNYNYNCVSPLPLEEVEVSCLDNMVCDHQLYPHVIG